MDGRSQLVFVGFRVLVRGGRALAFRIPFVWREGSRSPGLDGGCIRYRQRSGVQLHWDQLPNPTRLMVAVMLELYLDCRCLSDGLRISSSDDG